MVMSFLYGEAATGWIAQLRYMAFGLALALLRFAPIWSVIVLGLGALGRKRILPASLALWPAATSLCGLALPLLLFHSFFTGVIGTVHPITVAICALTVAFAIASVATLVTTIRWCFRADRPSVLALLMPMMFGLAFTALTVFLAAHGWLGFRTWAF